MSARIAIAGVSERDVDLLLLEEFQSSTSFRKLFLSRCPKLSDNVGLFTAASRSVTHSSGESDLEVDFLSADGVKTRLLIENKVRAGFQLQQAERYHLRGASYIAAGVCAAYHTVIVAPRRYFGD